MKRKKTMELPYFLRNYLYDRISWITEVTKFLKRIVNFSAVHEERLGNTRKYFLVFYKSQDGSVVINYATRLV